MNKFLTITALAVVLCAGRLSAQDTIPQPETTPGIYNFTLEDCINYAISSGYERQSMKLSEESADETYSQSQKDRLPSVNASAGESVSHTGSESGVTVSGNAGINASMTIYGGGQIKNNIEQSRVLSQQAKIQTSQYDDNLSIQIANQYLTALSDIEKQKYQIAILKAAKEQLAQGDVEYKAGSMIESDYLMLNAQYQNSLCDSLNTAISLENALLSLKQIMSMDVNAQINIISPDTTEIDQMALLPQQSEILNAAKEHMPDIQLAQSNIELAEYALESSKSGRRPQLTASAGLSTGHTDFDNVAQQLQDRFSQTAGINLSIPIFDRGATSLQIKKSRIQQQQAELTYKQAELEVSQTVINQYRTVQLEYTRYLSYKSKAEAYQKSYEAYARQFYVGKITAVDLLQQQNNYISVLNDYINAKYSFVLNREILDIYTGM